MSNVAEVIRNDWQRSLLHPFNLIERFELGWLRQGKRKKRGKTTLTDSEDGDFFGAVLGVNCDIAKRAHI